MPLNSTLKASDNPLNHPGGSLVVSSSSWTSIVTGQMANLLAVVALGSTLPIMMVVAFSIDVTKKMGADLLLGKNSGKGGRCLSVLYYKDDSCWSADLKSKTTEDIISIGSFMEVLVYRLLHHEVEGQVDRLVEEAEGLENQRAELVVRLVIKVVKEQLQYLLLTIIAQVGNHASNIQGDVRSANVSNVRNGCLYKEFMACNLKDYNGKGGAIVYTRWIEKIESVQDMSTQMRGREAAVGMTWEDFKDLMRKEFCPNNEMQKLETEFWCHAMVGVGYAAYTDRFHELARLVPYSITPENKRIERNGSLKKNTEKRGNGGVLSMKGNVRDDNKKSRTGRVFAIITNPVRKEYTGHFAKDCRARPRMVTPISARNPKTARGACFECGGGQGRGNNGNQAHGGALIMGAEEARKDPNIVTGTFILNNHYATTLFDAGVDYSFVSTTFIPLLDIEPSDLGFSYEIEIASRKLVEINKVIRDCKLEIEGHTFNVGPKSWI
ncbi:putative reverse transcriptase domain-containing protein [Tanacetum coccineum]